MPDSFITRRGGGSSKLFAVIGITYPAGAICTCSNGTKTLKAPDTSGKVLFAIPEAGEWTVAAVDGSDSDSLKFNVQAGLAYSGTLSFGNFFYNKGNQCVDKTGGWIQIGSAGQVVFGTEQMAVKVNSNGNRTLLSTVNKVDLTPIKTLIFTLKNTAAWPTGSPRYGVSADPKNAAPESGYLFSASSGIMKKNETFASLSLDVSSVNGEHYIVVGGKMEGTATEIDVQSVEWVAK